MNVDLLCLSFVHTVWQQLPLVLYTFSQPWTFPEPWTLLSSFVIGPSLLRTSSWCHRLWYRHKLQSLKKGGKCSILNNVLRAVTLSVVWRTDWVIDFCIVIQGRQMWENKMPMMVDLVLIFGVPILLTFTSKVSVINTKCIKCSKFTGWRKITWSKHSEQIAPVVYCYKHYWMVEQKVNTLLCGQLISPFLTKNNNEYLRSTRCAWRRETLNTGLGQRCFKGSGHYW